MASPMSGLRPFLRGALAAALLVGAPRAGASEQDSLDLTSLSLEELMEVEVVYAASRYEQHPHEAPASVTIVGAEEIRQMGYRTLADLLRAVRGFYTTQDRQYAYIGTRGFSRPGDYNTRILLQINGHRVNEELYSEAFFGSELPFSLDLVERVEVIRGPSSSVYGTNAFFGVVNVITKDPAEVPGVRLAGRAGSFGAFGTDADAGFVTSTGLQMLAGGTFSDVDGQDLYYEEFDAPETNDGLAAGADSERLAGGYIQASRGATRLQAFYGSREKVIPTAPYGVRFDDPRTNGTDGRGFVSLAHDRRTAGGLAFSGEVSYDWSAYDGDYVYDAEEEGAVEFYKDYARATWWEAGLSVSGTFAGRHRVVAGSQGRYDSKLTQKLYGAGDLLLDDDRTSYDWAVYAQDEIRIAPRVLLNLGARYDRYETFGGTTNPRLALIASPFAETVCKLLYGSAFRAPNVFELYYTDTGGDVATQKTNSDLGPEKIRTYELVVEQGIGRRSNLFASLFHTEVTGIISIEVDPADSLLVFRNRDEADSKGIELGAALAIPAGGRARLSWAFAESEDGETGERLTNSPRHVAKLGTIVPIAGERLSAGFELQYTGERKTPKGGTADAYAVTNLTLTSRLFRGRLELTAGVLNLFDERYDDPGSEEHEQDRIEQDGRAFGLKARVGF